MKVPSPEERAILGPSYQNLMARYGSNRATQWQVFGLGLTAQGFMIGAVSQVADRNGVAAWSLCIVIFAIGVATIGISFRFNKVIDRDRNLLDKYEEILLPETFEWLRLKHSAPPPLEKRKKETLEPSISRSKISRLKKWRTGFRKFVMNRIKDSFGSKRLVFVVVLECIIFLAAIAIPISERF